MQTDLLTFLQYVANGIVLGGVYGLVAVGLTLIYGVLKIINFSHGELVMGGMYVSYWCFVLWRIDPYVSAVISMTLFFCIGAVLQRYVVEPIMPAPQINQILLTIGVGLFLTNLAMVLFSPDTRTIHVSYATTTISFWGVLVSIPRLVSFVVAMVLSLGLYLFLRTTRLGKAVRAAAQDREGAQLVGIGARQVFIIAFGIGAGMAAVAGSLLTPFYNVQPTAGVPFVLTAYVIVVLGTMGNFLGALVGALLIGVAESVGSYLFSPALRQLVSFSIFIGVLLFKPEGLFGGKAS